MNFTSLDSSSIAPNQWLHLVSAVANWQNFHQFRGNFLRNENENFYENGVVLHSGDQITRVRVGERDQKVYMSSAERGKIYIMLSPIRSGKIYTCCQYLTFWYYQLNCAIKFLNLSQVSLIEALQYRSIESSSHNSHNSHSSHNSCFIWWLKGQGSHLCTIYLPNVTLCNSFSCVTDMKYY